MTVPYAKQLATLLRTIANRLDPHPSLIFRFDASYYTAAARSSRPRTVTGR